MALLLFVSVLLHELSHSMVSKRAGIDVKTITLFIFGGLAHIEGEPDEPLKELKIAIAGPAMSIFLYLIMLALASGIKELGAPELLVVPISYISEVNLVLAIFNLVPAFPLDGGRVLRALIWYFKGNEQAATRIASSMGAAFAYFLMFIGVFAMLTGDFINGVWLAFIGWFIHQISQTSYQQTVMNGIFKNIPVRDFMTTQVLTVDYYQSVEDLVQNFIYRYKYSFFPVMREGQVTGIVNLDRVKLVASAEWGQTTVQKIMLPLADNLVITPNENVNDALKKLLTNGIGRVVVMEGSRLEGIVSRTDIVNYLSIMNQLDR